MVANKVKCFGSYQPETETMFRSWADAIKEVKASAVKTPEELSETTAERTARIYTSIIRRLDKIHNNIEIEDSHTQDEILDAILVKEELKRLYDEMSDTLELEISQLNAKDDEINNEQFEPSYDDDSYCQPEDGEYFDEPEPDEDFARQIEAEQDFTYSSTRL